LLITGRNAASLEHAEISGVLQIILRFVEYQHSCVTVLSQLFWLFLVWWAVTFLVLCLFLLTENTDICS